MDGLGHFHLGTELGQDGLNSVPQGGFIGPFREKIVEDLFELLSVGGNSPLAFSL